MENFKEYKEYMYKKSQKSEIFEPYFLKKGTISSINELVRSEIGDNFMFCGVNFDKDYGFYSADYYEIIVFEKKEINKNIMEIRCKPYGTTPKVKGIVNYNYLYIDKLRSTVWIDANHLSILRVEVQYLLKINNKNEINEIINACKNSRIELEKNNYQNIVKIFYKTLPFFENLFMNK